MRNETQRRTTVGTIKDLKFHDFIPHIPHIPHFSNSENFGIWCQFPFCSGETGVTVGLASVIGR